MDICPSEEEVVVDDQQSNMLCNVLVRATHDLHVNQQKSRDEIEKFLKTDCQRLDKSELVEKVKEDFEKKIFNIFFQCEDLVERHGKDIYAHVASNVELTKVCDYLDNPALEVRKYDFR